MMPFISSSRSCMWWPYCKTTRGVKRARDDMAVGDEQHFLKTMSPLNNNTAHPGWGEGEGGDSPSACARRGEKGCRSGPRRTQ